MADVANARTSNSQRGMIMQQEKESTIKKGISKSVRAQPTSQHIHGYYGTLHMQVRKNGFLYWSMSNAFFLASG